MKMGWGLLIGGLPDVDKNSFKLVLYNKKNMI